jgi:predicted DsbA family dithiol-disulfide isomerase
MHSHLQSVAESVGLMMEPRDVIINSRRALGAAEFARDHGMFEEMHHALFQAHWEGTGRLENVDDLVRIGAEVGLDPVELREAIDQDRYAPVIDENRRAASSAGIDAIPAHIFGRRYLVVGAQPREVFDQVLEQLDTAE